MEDDDCERIALVGKAISDPCRVGILLNFRGRTLTISDITEELGTYQSNVSYHMAILSKAGLVTRIDDGRWHRYSVNLDIGDELRSFIQKCGQKQLANSFE